MITGAVVGGSVAYIYMRNRQRRLYLLRYQRQILAEMQDEMERQQEQMEDMEYELEKQTEVQEATQKELEYQTKIQEENAKTLKYYKAA